MKVRWLIFLLYSTLFFGCKKFVETPKETCFIPYVDFVAQHVDPTSLEVTFTSVTSFNGTITTHHWDFGDGTSYDGPNPPPHHYPAPASPSSSNVYRVKYTVANDCGQAFWTKDITIAGCLPDTKFSFSQVNDSTIQFVNQTTTASTASYSWNFGDGSTGTANGTVTHTYAQDGNYTVTLKATNSCGDNFYTRNISICRAPVPAQTITPSGCGSVTINASATRNGGKYQWNFGNGVVLPATPSSTATISYTYPSPGTYNITLTVINPLGCDTATITNPVTITASGVVPNNNWNYTSDDLEFNFSRDPVVNATSYSWSFGDGTTASVQNPGVRVFADPGTYNISLGASNACGAYNLTRTITAPYYKVLNNFPNTGLREVAAVNAQQIYYLGLNGKLYRTDTAGNWSPAINLPSGISFNNDTHLFRDQNNNLWVFGKGEVAKFNPSNSGWTSFYNSTGFPNNTTILGMAIDNNGVLWTIDDRHVRKGNDVVSTGSNIFYSSIVFAPGTNRIWLTALNRESLYYANSTANQLSTINVSAIVNGAEQMHVAPNGELFFATQTGIVRTSSTGVLMNNYVVTNTNYLLTNTPSQFNIDNRGNIWAIHASRLLKIPVNASANTKNYSVVTELFNLNALDVLTLSATDTDLLLAKTNGNAAIRVR